MPKRKPMRPFRAWAVVDRHGMPFGARTYPTRRVARAVAMIHGNVAAPLSVARVRVTEVEPKRRKPT